MKIIKYSRNQSTANSFSLWLDASDASTITHVAGAVSQWNDKSGLGNHATQGTGAKQPITGTRTINAKNTIDFDGTDDDLVVPSAAFNYGASTCIYVCMPDTTTANLMVLSGNGYGAAQTDFAFCSQQLAIGNVFEFRAVRTSGLPILNVARVNQTGAATQKIIWDNEAQLSKATIRAGIGGNFRIGSYAGAAPFLNGVIAELLFWKRELSNSEVNLVCNYLQSKWGVTWTNI